MRYNDHPSVSVILPTYNRAACLNRSIDSVLNQSFAEFELIVVDDGSTDETESLVASYGDSRVVYVRLQQNRGLSAARNAGLERARGRFLAFQDSDDEWYSNKLEVGLKAFANNPQASVVYSDMIRRSKDGREKYMKSPEINRGRLINPETGFWQPYMLAMQPCLIRRSRIENLRFDESFHFFEDLDFHLSLGMDNDYVHIKQPSVIYNESDGLTADPSREPLARRQLLKKYRHELRQQSPGFFIRESVNILLRRSLMPIVRQHLVPM